MNRTEIHPRYLFGSDNRIVGFSIDETYWNSLENSKLARRLIEHRSIKRLEQLFNIVKIVRLLLSDNLINSIAATSWDA